MGPFQVSEQDLEGFKKQLAKELGLYYAAGKNAELLAKLLKIQKKFHFPDATSCVRYLSKGPLTKDQVASLAKELTIGETYFFRNQSVYQNLEQKILPEIIEEKRKNGNTLNIWSAGCCTGEEPYSIAILLHRLIPDLSSWKLNLIGTDINEEFLQKAKSGEYKEWSFRNLSPKFIGPFFKETEPKKYSLIPEIKKMVKFKILNLIDADYGMEKMDLILCNHVLIYFTPHHIKEVVSKFVEVLSENGQLLVSSIEVPFVEHPKLHWDRTDQTIVFKKRKGEVKAKPTLTPNSQPIKKTAPTLPATPVKEESSPIESIRKLANAGSLKEARAKCEEALKKDRVNASLYYIYGVILHELDEPDISIQALKHCLFLDPRFVMAHFSLGMHFLQLGRASESKKQIRNALGLLKEYQPEDLIPGGDDMTAERLRFIAEGVLNE